jgi:hypothetical protein
MRGCWQGGSNEIKEEFKKIKEAHLKNDLTLTQDVTVDPNPNGGPPVMT